MDELIKRFYTAFNEGDGAAMAACYTPDAHFWDPVFQDLNGAEPGQMWRMLTSRSGDLRIELPEHASDNDRGTAHWIAHYTFTQTGRKVVNDVQATFAFRDGQISEHDDRFSFWTWSRQALGTPGLVAGWTPLLRNKVSAQARAGLEEFRAGR
jgi:ketosteroid isomerase-like protein